jgi:hypothetical protein
MPCVEGLPGLAWVILAYKPGDLVVAAKMMADCAFAAGLYSEIQQADIFGSCFAEGSAAWEGLL